MQHLSKLLEVENSNLAWVLRLGLCGLRSQLQEALNTASHDSGRIVCEEFLKELDVLLQSVSTPESVSDKNILPVEDSSSWEDVLEPVVSSSSELHNSDLTPIESSGIGLEFPEVVVPGDVMGELKLKPIAETLVCDRELSNYIGQYHFHSTNDADLWNEIQLLLLRVPEKMAHGWREHITKAVSQIGAVENQVLHLSLPFVRNECVYPGLTGGVNATGLWLSDQVGFDSRLMVKMHGEEINILAGVVSTCLKLMEIDPCLHHALKSVDRFGVRSLNSESEKSKYITALLDRFQRVQASADGEDPTLALRARLDLDEAIHSLVYLPCADRYSWWGKLQQEARRTLDSVVEMARHGGYSVQIRPLWGIYADVFNWSKDDLQLDIGGVRGEVSACLRVYAKINDEVLSGRVLFRSS
ncbi:MAG: hypothetical protein SAK29_42505 [Scytonema sp. PMC 1069.18]|nr:hypothetical protein [Scytonema sp. PMC 1069.18]MEC4881121.1 hypothetical protein [Scytonema sp. PMC 1070.18]